MPSPFRFIRYLLFSEEVNRLFGMALNTHHTFPGRIGGAGIGGRLRIPYNRGRRRVELRRVVVGLRSCLRIAVLCFNDCYFLTNRYCIALLDEILDYHSSFGAVDRNINLVGFNRSKFFICLDRVSDFRRYGA